MDRSSPLPRRSTFMVGGFKPDLWPTDPWDQLSEEVKDALEAMGITRETYRPGEAPLPEPAKGPEKPSEPAGVLRHGRYRLLLGSGV